MITVIRAQCPSCGHVVDDASAVGEDKTARPETGDFALCIACAEPASYVTNEDGTLGLRALSEDEKVELFENEEIAGVQQMLQNTTVPWFSAGPK